jgi:hypothetical protein
MCMCIYTCIYPIHIANNREWHSRYYTVHGLMLINAGPFVQPSMPNQYLEWLKNDLSSVDRKCVPWVIVFVHRPYYVSKAVDKAVAFQAAFESIFVQYQVDMVIHGHIRL